jgi:hypothetical protein
MNFLQRLFGGSSAKSENRYHTFNVKCKRCGETLEGRVDLYNDLSVEYEADKEVYYCRKVLMGDNKCFQHIEVEFKFTSARTLIEQQVSGGEFVS